MVKVRISATIDRETERILDRLMKSGDYRNKSHVIEKLIKLAGEENGKKK